MKTISTLILLLFAFAMPAFSQNFQPNSQQLRDQQAENERIQKKFQQDQEERNRQLANDMEMMRRKQSALIREHEDSLNDIRTTRSIEGPRYRDEKTSRDLDNQLQIQAEQKKQRDETLASVQVIEAQVAGGTALTRNQLEWVTSNGRILKTYLESPEIRMIMDKIEESETGFTGVSGRLLLDPVKARATKEKILADQSLFQRLYDINERSKAIEGERNGVTSPDAIHLEASKRAQIQQRR